MTAIKDVPPGKAAVRPLRVLLVDDDQEDSFLFEAQVHRLTDYEVDLVWTNDYDDALRRMRAEEFDCHFVDFRLGRASGMELLSRALEQNPAKSIVLLTGYGDENVQAESLRRGAVAYLSKAELNASRLQRCISACTADFDRRARLDKVDARLIDQESGAYKLDTFIGAAKQELDAERGSALQQVILKIDLDKPAAKSMKAVADAIRGCLRRSDMLGRCGDSSFCVLTQSWEGWMALELAEQIRTAVERATGLSVTIGGARTSSENADAQELIARSTEAAQSAARQDNRVEVRST